MTQDERIVAEARRWIGTPYRHQASTIGAGADCLGLVRGVWRTLIGEEPEALPPYSADWAEPMGREDLADAADRWLVRKATTVHGAGDIILFRMRQGAIAKHLGIGAFQGGIPTVIHAYSGHGVCETALSAPWQRKIAARYNLPIGAK